MASHESLRPALALIIIVGLGIPLFWAWSWGWIIGRVEGLDSRPAYKRIGLLVIAAFFTLAFLDAAASVARAAIHHEPRWTQLIPLAIFAALGISVIRVAFLKPKPQ